jgi:hypothetical protein
LVTMANKAVKIDSDLYNKIVKLIKSAEYKYKYNSISAFINETVYERLKEDKHHSKFFKIKL